MSDEILSYDWEDLQEKILNSGMTFSILVSTPPSEEPLRPVSSVTLGLDPRNMKFLKTYEDQ